uniref:Rad21/Rec8-like protein N-terminal domain-containing protein n=1 Tax=Echeneis naucrates TaxID=173247 RepID=A0A665UZ84_ECHNA
MFYYPTVLKHHTGCFSTIWLVATKGIRVPRRDFLKVNVKSTCDDIMNYVLERVPPPRPDLPRPRFSLYLSSQLQYGVIVVYHRQCAILLEELHTICTLLLFLRQPLVFPDALTVMEETEGALDPLFGVMYMQHPLPSPTTLKQIFYQFHFNPFFLSLFPGLTASPDTITLREMEPLSLPITEVQSKKHVNAYTLFNIIFLICSFIQLSFLSFFLMLEEAPLQVKRRKRQLIFYDPETQLSRDELQEQINNPLTETRPLPPPPSIHRAQSAVDLLSNPYTCQYKTCFFIRITASFTYSGITDTQH